jgi:hypothetical protein
LGEQYKSFSSSLYILLHSPVTKNYLLFPEIFMGCSKTGREICLIVSWWEECWWIYAITFSSPFQK